MNHVASDLQHQPWIASTNGLYGPPGDAFSSTEVTAVHPSDDGIWLLIDGRQLWHRRSGVDQHVADAPGRAGCVIEHRGQVYVAGDDASLWQLTGDQLIAVDSFWSAPTRDDWYTPWGGPPSIFSMASHGDDLYVGVHVGGIIRTSDAGDTWTPTIDLHVDVHQVVVDGRGVVYAATGTSALATSDDRGATWRFHDRGLHARYALAVAATTHGVLIGVSSGHAARNGRIYRFDGDRFEVPSGLPADIGGAVGPGCLAAAGDDAMVALPNGDVFASSDGGRNWSPLMSGVGRVSQIALATT